MTDTHTLRGFASTNIGRRANNEDAYLVADGNGVFAVADGMGGYDGGEVASAMALATLERHLLDSDVKGEVTELDPEATSPLGVDLRPLSSEGRVREAILAANRSVCAARRGRLREMGTTIAAVVVDGDQATIAHVGDSRVYRFRDCVLELLTRDHSLVAELGRSSDIAELSPQLRNVVTRALGREHTNPDVRRISCRAGDCFILCTDGLTEKLDDAAIAEVVSAHPSANVAAELVARALRSGASDNITVVVACL